MEPRHPPGPLLAATTSNAGQIAIAFVDSNSVTSAAYTRRSDGLLGTQTRTAGTDGDKAGGAPDRIRTCDLRLRRPTLYPLSYRRADRE